jgi:uncharacterized protein (TIGR02757 family)
MKDLKVLLDDLVKKYNNSSFIEADPISIPHQYTLKQDIEITAFWTAILAWGQRKTIINKATQLFEMMDNKPYDFIRNHQSSDLKPFEHFKHRTFQADDTLYFIEFLKHHYSSNESLESAFIDSENPGAEAGLNHFRTYFFSLNKHLRRTEKHITAPFKKSTCKRLCMFLRWMVRKDDNGVDFGIWNAIKPADLYMPLDVHVERVAREFKLLKRKQRDWKSVVELTENLRKIDPKDPVKYDFALFGYGVDS